MKLLLFKFYSLFVFISAFAQERTVFNKSISTEAIDKLELELENIPLEISESVDDKIHIDFKMNFVNYSKKEIDSVLGKINIKNDSKNRKISLKSKDNISKVQYSTELNSIVDFVLGWKAAEKENNQKNAQRKSRYDLIKEINDEELSFFDKKELDKMCKEDAKSKITKANFVLYLPKKLSNNLKINAKNTIIDIQTPVLTNFELIITESTFKAKELISTRINSYNTYFKVEQIKDGKVKFDSSGKISIADIENTKISLDNSIIQLGEIREEISINDFYSKVYLYNFSNHFKTFNFTGEYSTIYFFEPKNDYEMSCFGHDTTFYFNGEDAVISQPSKTGRKSKMMTRDRKNDKPFAGAINFDVVHTKFYYPTELKINKK